MRLRNLVQPIVLVPVVIVALIVGVWWFAFRPSDDASASATTTKQLATVTSGPMSVNVSAEGTVAAAQTDDLSFSSAGTVTAVDVKAGDTVTAGEVLATIDSAALQSGVSSAQASLASAQAKLSDDQASGASSAQISADEASVTSANDALTDATSALAKASLVATFDGTVSAVNITEGEQLASGGSGGTATTGTGSGSGQSSAALGSSSTGSNRAGAAATGGTSDSSSSSSSSAQISVVSTGRYTVDLAVDSSDVASVKVGQTATVTRTTSSAATGRFGGLGAFFNRAGNGAGTGAGGTGTGSGTGTNGATGTGRSTATTGATATGLVTAVSRVADASSGVATYPVTIAFDSTGSDFFVGSTVSGDIATNVRQNVVQVSSLAITTTDTGSTVALATNETVNGPTQTRTVTTGLTASGNTEITSGLKAGDKVVIAITRPGGFSPPAGFQRGTGGGFGGGDFPGGARAGG